MDVTEQPGCSSQDRVSKTLCPKTDAVAASLGCLPFAFPGVAKVACLFSTSLAGNMSLGLPGEKWRMDNPEKEAALACRKKLLRALGLCSWVELYQVHQDTVHANPCPTAPEYPSSLEGDGSCTQQKGLALAVKTADCQPLLLSDRQGRAVAALHVGWRGNVLNFPASGLRRFCEAYALMPEDVLAVRGPSLGPGAAEFINFAHEWPSEFSPWFDEQRRTMDLWSLTRDQLIRAGMRPEHIFSLDLCTHSLPELFFSYRRKHTQRQISLIWITG